MSGYLVLPDSVAIAGAPPLMSFMLPTDLPSDLKGLYIFDGTFGDPLNNYANQALPLTKIGNPTSSQWGYTLSSSNGFQTGLSETTAMTIAMIAKPLATGGAILAHCGTTSSGPDGASLYFGDSGGGSALRGGAKDGSNAFVNRAVFQADSGGAPNTSDWHILITAIDGSGIRTLWGRGGTDYSFSSSVTGRTVKSGTIRFGGSGTASSSYNSSFTAALGMVWQRKLDTDELAEVTASLRAYLAAGGVTTA